MKDFVNLRIHPSTWHYKFTDAKSVYKRLKCYYFPLFPTQFTVVGQTGTTGQTVAGPVELGRGLELDAATHQTRGLVDAIVKARRKKPTSVKTQFHVQVRN